ncbi:MAG: FAD-dependent oxidoreductase [Lentisphaerae bacterium]|nr:FAD-dependent oxidoreductase [Lentisphaerota bacterium]
MNTYSEPKRKLPIVGDYDVLVCGGGTSGIPSAISAARAGAKVALIERGIRFE